MKTFIDKCKACKAWVAWHRSSCNGHSRAGQHRVFPSAELCEIKQITATQAAEVPVSYSSDLLCVCVCVCVCACIEEMAEVREDLPGHTSFDWN